MLSKCQLIPFVFLPASELNIHSSHLHYWSCHSCHSSRLSSNNPQSHLQVVSLHTQLVNSTSARSQTPAINTPSFPHFTIHTRFFFLKRMDMGLANRKDLLSPCRRGSASLALRHYSGIKPHLPCILHFTPLTSRTAIACLFISLLKSTAKPQNKVWCSGSFCISTAQLYVQ